MKIALDIVTDTEIRPLAFGRMITVEHFADSTEVAIHRICVDDESSVARLEKIASQIIPHKET